MTGLSMKIRLLSKGYKNPSEALNEHLTELSFLWLNSIRYGIVEKFNSLNFFYIQTILPFEVGWNYNSYSNQSFDKLC